jgi:hypothetical protein
MAALLSMRQLCLRDYVEVWTVKPFSLDDAHCMAFVADWLANVRGLDARAAWAGPGALTVKEIMVRPKVLRSHAICAARAMGLAETCQPITGDVGLVWVLARAERPLQLVGAIRGNGLWYVKTGQGVLAADAPCEIAWSIANG